MTTFNFLENMQTGKLELVSSEPDPAFTFADGKVFADCVECGPVGPLQAVLDDKGHVYGLCPCGRLAQ